MKLELYVKNVSAEFPESWYSTHKTWKSEWTNNWEDWQGDWADWKTVWGTNWEDWKNIWDNNWGSDWTGDWGDQWTSQWEKNADMRPGKSQRLSSSRPPSRMPGLQLREETFGGLFFDPVSEGVFQVDHEAFKAISMLNNNIGVDEVAEKLRLPADDLNTLTNFLTKYNLW